VDLLMSDITIVVVDDHPIFRQGVVDALSLEKDFAIIGQASNGDDALELIRNYQPQVALIDVNLPGINGQQVTRQVKSEKLPTRILLFTAYDDAEQKIHAMLAGAFAYCAKDIHPDHLVQMVRHIRNGKFVVGQEVFDPSGLEGWLEAQTKDATRPYSDPGEPFHPLSSREMEVLSCVTQGMSNKEIASKLGISHQTVKNHVTSILRKLGVEDRTQAAVYALRRGWVRLHQEDTQV
jgi:DNA-binding NarL/FixJ family response regulator